MGKIREAEMHDSAIFYGAATCTVIEDPRCQDCPNEKWDRDFIVNEIFKKKIIAELKADFVITFDDYGVSGHKNHRDTYANMMEGYKELFSQSSSNSATRTPPRFFKLVSLPIWRKYSSIFGVLIQHGYENIREFIFGDGDGKKKSSSSTTLTFVLPPSEGFQSMRGLWRHRSQFVWFRFFYVLMASYSYENILEEF